MANQEGKWHPDTELQSQFGFYNNGKRIQPTRRTSWALGPGGQRSTTVAENLIKLDRKREALRKKMVMRLEEQHGDSDALFDQLDGDKDGKLSLKEFRIALDKMGMALLHQDSRSLMASIDTNGDGYIDKSELKNYLAADQLQLNITAEQKAIAAKRIHKGTKKVAEHEANLPYMLPTLASNTNQKHVKATKHTNQALETHAHIGQTTYGHLLPWGYSQDAGDPHASMVPSFIPRVPPAVMRHKKQRSGTHSSRRQYATRPRQAVSLSARSCWPENFNQPQIDRHNGARISTAMPHHSMRDVSALKHVVHSTDSPSPNKNRIIWAARNQSSPIMRAGGTCGSCGGHQIGKYGPSDSLAVGNIDDF